MPAQYRNPPPSFQEETLLLFIVIGENFKDPLQMIFRFTDWYMAFDLLATASLSKMFLK